MAGKTARCPGCGNPVTVQAPKPKSAQAPPSAPPPLPAGKISVSCSCGKTLKAPASAAGKTAKCPACGTPLTIPAPAPAGEPEVDFDLVPKPPEDPVEGEVVDAPERPARGGTRLRRGGVRGAKPRGRAPRTRMRDRGPKKKAAMPGLAIMLVVLALIETFIIGLVAVGITLFGGLISGMSSDGGSGISQAVSEGVVEGLQDQGFTITRDEVIVDADGGKVRRIEFTTPDGQKGAQDLPAEGFLGKELSGKGVALGGIIMIVGFGLMGVCFGKLLCSIGFFMKKNWGRIGLVVFCGLETVLLLLAVFAAGWSVISLLPLLVSGAILIYFLTPSVKAACA